MAPISTPQLAETAQLARTGDISTFDPIGMEVFSNRLLAITEEMGNLLIRSSFSTNIKERKDCSVAIFDRRGRLVVQATHIPLHVGSLSGAVEAVLAKVLIEDIRPGDTFISNDAYLAGGSHSPDITVVTPVFDHGRLEFFVTNIGHHSDVGGAVPGSTAHHLRSVWEEGLRIPVMRIVREGVLDTDLLEMIAHNTREFENRVNDIKAQLATNDRGVRLMSELIAMSGLESILSSVEDILEYTERRLRKIIAGLPQGRVSFTEYMDDDGFGGDPVPITANVEAKGEELIIDFEGTGKQSRGGFNISFSNLRACAYYAVKTMLDPELMPNNGMFNPIRVSAPLGTITNPRFPGAVGARATTAQRVAGAVVGALVHLAPPERAMASSNDVMPAMLFSGPARRGDKLFVYLETLGGGAGGRAVGDGMDGIQVHVTNTSNLPVEALEIEYPLLVEEYALITDSGGAGKYRGGMGIARQIRSLVDGMNCAVRCDGALHGAAGLLGGEPGTPGRVFSNYGRPDRQQMPPKIANHILDSGQSMRIETPGAGGFGPPQERNSALLEHDVLTGKVSWAAADRDYGKQPARVRT